MQAVSHQSSLSAMSCLSDVEQIIDRHLRRDWLIRIQHTHDLSAHYTPWQQWGEALYAVQDAAVVIEKIIACRTSYPLHAIRIHAEKHRPEMYFTYWVYRLRDETPAMTQKTALPAITDVGKKDLPVAYTEMMPVPRNRFWRIVSIGGMLLASVMVFEVATV